jgi:hypothetical protein
MTRREAILTAVVLYAIALVARAVTASLVVFPIPEDTAYYVAVSKHLVEGRGQLRHVAAQMPHGDVQKVAEVLGFDIGERDWLSPSR